jgi:hypothetical protein
LANAATEHVQAWDLLQQGSNGLAHLLASVSGFDFGTAPIEDVTQIGAGQEDHQASNDTMVCEEPIESVCDVDDQTVGVAQEVCEIEKEVCEIEPASRPLDQVMSEAMKARGADQDAITRSLDGSPTRVGSGLWRLLQCDRRGAARHLQDARQR